MKYSRKCLICGKEVISSNRRTFFHKECRLFKSLLIASLLLSFVCGCKPVPAKETSAGVTEQATIAHQCLIALIAYKSNNPFKNGWLALGLVSWLCAIVSMLYLMICCFIPGVNRWYRVLFRGIFVGVCVWVAHYCVIRSI